MAKLLRKIVVIDEDKCDGCGWCIDACAEGALRIIDGKARLVSETYCDGLGACLGGCPQNAITVEEREAEVFEGEAPRHETAHAVNVPFGGCPSARILEFERIEPETGEKVAMPSALRHWPVQLALLPPSAPFLRDADFLLTADCVPFAMASFHEHFLRGHALAVACPKLDDCEAHLEKLTSILRGGGLKSLTVVIMEVPCCGGLMYLAKQALAASGSNIPLNQIVISTRGEVISEKTMTIPAHV
jgi:NAD-dependent dihydropyrimidine dehydrogenase PreA subunit